MLLGIVLVGCAALPQGSIAPSFSPTPSPGGTLRYVALGDSYTIGTGVRAQERFPEQLVAALRPAVDVELVANLGVNGYTSRDLIADELPALDGLAPDFVTLLIGVNDVVRGVPLAMYRDNVRLILDELLTHVASDRVVVVSIPDYTLTPAGGSFGDPAQQRAAIDDSNAAMAAEAAARGIAFVDIGTVADLVPTDPTLVASDRLHPSGAHYARWVELIAPVIRGLIGADA